MKPLTLFLCILALWLCWDSAESGTSPFDFLKQAYHGSKDMYKAYKDMREANWKGADKYFHARGNYDAAKRGPGGAWAAEKISNAREFWQGRISGRGAKDSMADQVANKWGRSGKNPNAFRPPGLPKKY